LKTRETVATETRATRATSLIVTIRVAGGLARRAGARVALAISVVLGYAEIGTEGYVNVYIMANFVKSYRM
jgi:hypothetical protein